MPTYEYECPRCPRVFEVRQRITEPALDTCDRCGGAIHRPVFGAAVIPQRGGGGRQGLPAPFILKGEGWYVTDYPSDARKKATSAESSGKEAPAKEPSSAKDGGSAESKAGASSDSTSTPDATPAASSASKPSPDGAAASASSTSKSS